MSESPPPSADFFPPGWTVVLRGEWHFVVSEGIRAVQVVEAGEMELRHDEAGPMIENYGSINIWGIGADYYVGEGEAWMPWYGMAVIAGALAPFIVDALPKAEEERDA
jgi:hypothetical protein